MDLDFYYIKIFLSPLLGFTIAMLVMKLCCRSRCFTRSASTSELRHRSSPIYVIPIAVNDGGFDAGSLSSVLEFAPPAYDAVAPVAPPPPYSEWKISGPNEEPPAYVEIAEEPPFACSLTPETRHTERTRNARTHGARQTE